MYNVYTVKFNGTIHSFDSLYEASTFARRSGMKWKEYQANSYRIDGPLGEKPVQKVARNESYIRYYRFQGCKIN